MPKFFVRWLVTAVTILATPHLISGIYVDGIGTALAVAAVLALLNILIRPLLILITLPLTVVTLGFFILVINGFLFKIAGGVVMGFAVDSLSWAILASLLVSFVSWICNLSLNKESGRFRFAVHNNNPNRKQTIDLNSDHTGNWK